jgi:hypothetical protein
LTPLRKKEKHRAKMTLSPSAGFHGAKFARLAAVLAAVILAEPGPAEPPGRKPSSPVTAPDFHRIAFVHLRFAGDQVQLVDFKVVPGRFKTAPEPAGERILLQVVGSLGKPLWEGWLNDPRTRVLEFEDSAPRGGRRGMAVAVANPEVTVRVPFLEEGQAIQIWRIAPARGSVAAHYQQLNSLQLREN